MTTEITFQNNIDLPINIETWYNGNYDTILVTPNTSIHVKSETGEFFLNNIIFNKECSDQWKTAGYSPTTMGKFRTEPSYNGENCWYIPDDFKLNYCNEKNTAIFIKKI